MRYKTSGQRQHTRAEQCRSHQKADLQRAVTEQRQVIRQQQADKPIAEGAQRAGSEQGTGIGKRAWRQE